METELGFELATSALRFGAGVTREIGMDLADLGVRRALVLTDDRLVELESVATVCESLRGEGIDFAVYDEVRVEPTDGSLQDAAAVAVDGGFDAYVAVGGGSVMDTAKAANLYATWPAAFLDYVNAPIGKGLPVPGPVKPLFAVPTTAGTGSETTGVIIFDLEAMHAKTGIASRLLKPTLGLVDPNNTRTMPPLVAASTGLDVLTHAVESYTALPFHQRAAPARPQLRPTYQGANPISDIWSLQAMRLIAPNLVRAVEDPADDEARAAMALAATFAGIGFGNAGCTIPHAMSYPVSGMARDYFPAGYPDAAPMVPHGIAVVLNAPAAFRFTAAADPARHLAAAAALGADVAGVEPDGVGECLAQTVIGLMRRLGVPNGLSGVGYTPDDIDRLVAGVLPQRRLLDLAPLEPDAAQLAELFSDAMEYW